MAITLTLRQYNSFTAALGPQWMKTVRKGLRAGAMRSVRILQEATMKAPSGSNSPGAQGFFGAVNTGAYRRAWKWRETNEGVSIFNNMPYAPVIEYGRRPGKGISREGQIALARWVRRKMKVKESEAKGIAYCIARAHKRRGLKGRRVLRDSLKSMKNVLNAEVEKAIYLVLRKK